MEFEKLISITGKGSLYKIISRTNFGLIAESLEDGKRLPVYQSDEVSTLADISIYREADEEIALKEVLLKIYDHEGGKATAALNSKDPEIKKYFEGILADYDKERVYVSNIKKLLKWYNQLVKTKLIDPEAWKKEEGELEKSDETTEVKSTETVEKKVAVKKEKSDTPKKKVAATKTNKPAPTVKNAPAKKVQTVRKSGGS